MTDLSGLTAAIDQMEAAQSAAVTEMRELRDEIDQLSEGTISQEQIDSLAGRATAAAQALASAVTEDDAPEQEQPVDPQPPAPEGDAPTTGDAPPAPSPIEEQPAPEGEQQPQ